MWSRRAEILGVLLITLSTLVISLYDVKSSGLDSDSHNQSSIAMICNGLFEDAVYERLEVGIHVKSFIFFAGMIVAHDYRVAVKSLRNYLVHKPVARSHLEIFSSFKSEV